MSTFNTIFQKAIFIREFEMLLLKLFGEGKLNGTVHTCVGEEVIAPVLCRYTTDQDTFFSNHRGHGHYIAKTGDHEGLLAEVMGKVNGCSGGYGGSQHLFYKGFYSNGIQGGFAPVATGHALSQKWKGNKDISVIFIGDGTMGEGTLYEAFNLASIYGAPILFVLENNGYAQSTSLQQTKSGDFKQRLEGFGVRYQKADIWNLETLDRTFQDSVTHVRSGAPAFVEVECYRLNSHSKGDDNRDQAEVTTYREKDPINQFETTQPDLFHTYQTQAKETLSAVFSALDSVPVLEHADTVSLLTNQPVEKNAYHLPAVAERINERIYKAIHQYFSHQSNARILGEDIENNNQYNPQPYGGAFKVTKDLSNLYPGRVLNTPISEAGITGLGIGLALAGDPSIVEIMFGDFTTLIIDQLLQQASKIQGMYGRKLPLPFIVRTPMGGKRGYGPTHSQTYDRLFMGVPHLHLVALNRRVDPYGIYETLFNQLDTATVVLENKIDYALYLNAGSINTHEYQITQEAFPCLVVSPRSAVPEVTLFCYGGNLSACEEAAKELFLEEELFVEIICPTLIQPFNVYPVLQSVKQTRKLAIVEEGADFASLGSELAAAVAEHATHPVKIKRMGNYNIIPSSFKAELNMLPEKEKIKTLIKQLI